MPPTVGQVIQGEPAAEVGLLEGGEIVEVDGVAVLSWSDESEIRRHRDADRAGLESRGCAYAGTYYAARRFEGDSKIGRMALVTEKVFDTT